MKKYIMEETHLVDEFYFFYLLKKDDIHKK